MCNRPNIVLINCDDLGYGDLTCYGSGKNKTPNIDSLAEDGKKFTDFYMASAVCSPSRAAMLTGCYPPRIGVTKVLFPEDSIGLSQDETTIAGQLKKRGYSTKIIGKWHCGDQKEFLPTKHGFDEYFGIPYSNDMGRLKNNPFTKEMPPLPVLRDEDVVQEQPDQRGITERYTVEATEFITKNKDKPFFLYLAHMYVHVPLFIPKQFLEKSDNGAYGGAVECIDWSTGIILDKLKELGLDDNTLVIFTSDNGSRARDEGGSNYPCRGLKAETYEGGIRVPCIMRWPGKIKPGTVSCEIVRSIDFLPTISKIAEVELPEKPIDGKDISELIFSENKNVASNTFFYYVHKGLHAARVGDWKLHFCHYDKEIKELYNLRDDVGENNNLYDEHPEIVKLITEECNKIRDELGDELLGIAGTQNRKSGYVEAPEPLTKYKENGPYMIAEYDLADMPTMNG